MDDFGDPPLEGGDQSAQAMQTLIGSEQLSQQAEQPLAPEQTTAPSDDYSATGLQQQPPDANSGLTELQQEALQHYGFDQSWLSGKSDEDIQQFLGAMDRQTLQQWQQGQQVQGDMVPQQQIDPQALQQMEEQQAQEAEEQGYQGFSHKPLEYEWPEDNMFEPEVVEVFDKIASNSNDQFSELANSIQQIEMALGGMIQESDTAQEQAFEQQMDQYFGGLDGPMSQHYGAGDARSMDPNSQELNNRRAFVNEMMALHDAQIQQGHAPDSEHLMHRVMRSRHPNESDAMVRRGMRQQVKQRQSQMMARPNSPMVGRGGSDRDRANMVINDGYRNLGMEPSPLSDFLEGDL
jgi:hypothetical protein